MKRISWNRFDGKLPPNTKVVMRPSKYGNPYKVSEYGRDECLRLYTLYLEKCIKNDPGFLDGLKGHDLACSCALTERCHADILIERVKACKARWLDS